MGRFIGIIRAAVVAAALATGSLPGAAEGQETVAQSVARLQQQVEQLQRQLAVQDTSEIAELRRQIEALSRQLESMQLGGDVVRSDSSVYGFAPAASKVYRVESGLSIGGYGEFLYENVSDEREDGADSGRQDRFDALRAILYVGYKFSDKVLFNSELEWEHGSTGLGGEASIEFAYIDYLVSPALGLRGGLLLAPMGLTNEIHEPPTFAGTTRPLVEQAIIPTTWRANGFGIFGEMAGFSYRSYALTSLDAQRGFSGAGLRGGRQKGANEVAEDFTLVGRVDYSAFPGLLVGASASRGETGHNRLVDGEEVDGTTTIVEGHVDYQGFGVNLRSLYAVATVDDAAQLNRLRNLTGNASIGEKLTGGFIEAGFDVLSRVGITDQLTPYVRYEMLNTQDEVPVGFSVNPVNDRSAWLLGAMWKPVPEVALKADYQIQRNEANTGVNQFNVNLSYLF